jgi:hypothetical protein
MVDFVKKNPDGGGNPDAGTLARNMATENFTTVARNTLKAAGVAGQSEVTCTQWQAMTLGVLVFFCRCDYPEGVKQVRSTADLQTITARIENGKAHGSGTDVERIVATAVANVHGGRDAWGHPYAWHVRQGATGLSYVVLSTGSDGQLDVPAIEEYFTKEGHEVLRSSEHERDIVFRDGTAIVTGGK